jgi:hypothetical protein
VLEDRSDPTKFRDIESVIDLTIPTVETSSVAWWALGGFSFMAAALAIGMVVSRRDKWMTPNQWATARLDQLEHAIQMQSAEREDATMQLSNIVRDLLLMQFNIPESGRTPQELLKKLHSQKRLDKATVNQLGELFILADKAKFAGLHLSPEGLQSAIKDTRGLIQSIDLAESQRHSDPDPSQSS